MLEDEREDKKMPFEEKEKITIEDLKSGDFIQFKGRNSTYVVVKQKHRTMIIPIYLERAMHMPMNEIIEAVFNNKGDMKMHIKEDEI